MRFFESPPYPPITIPKKLDTAGTLLIYYVHNEKYEKQQDLRNQA